LKICELISAVHIGLPVTYPIKFKDFPKPTSFAGHLMLCQGMEFHTSSADNAAYE